MDEESLLYQKLQLFCGVSKEFRKYFELTEKLKKLDRKDKNDRMLQYIADSLFNLPQYFEYICKQFAKELPKLICSMFPSSDTQINFEKHLTVCVLLSKIVRYRTDYSSYAQKYFEKLPSPFCNKQDYSQSKKIKMTESPQTTDLEIVEACYIFLKSDPDFYRNKWNWTDLIKNYFNHDDNRIKWVLCHCISILLGMNEGNLKALILSKLSMEDHEMLQYTIQFNLKSTLIQNEEKIFTEPEVTPNIIPTTATENSLVQVTNICGIYIPSISSQLEISRVSNSLLEVPSTYNNLQKIVLGLSANRAICLQGPVGCGKTSLVEYLATKTGRVLGKSFIKMQLGDQTDSKMLLGTYRCTDMAGEFVWEPGVLTQAVNEGSWLLLEDIDSASMDIASVLTSLLENKNLTVPGYRDSVPVSPSFQLFVTQRLITTSSGHHKLHSNAVNLLEKYLLRVNVEPLSTDELKQIIDTYYTKFQTISDRLINAFQLFSENKSDLTHKVGRIVSTRDFFKWCSRASVNFDVKSQESALTVLQNAIDVFCCSNQNINEAVDLAKEISTQLGIINQKAEYFFKNYKPTVQLTSNKLMAGRVALTRENNDFIKQCNFCFTRPSAILLERIMCCVQFKEPVLLVGETGTGKTSSVQYLASTIGQKLIVINMNQQSDSADLLGGFKPVDLKFVITPIKREFDVLFADYYKIEPNKKYLSNVMFCFNTQKWDKLVSLMQKSTQAAQHKLSKEIDEFKDDFKDSTSIERNEKSRSFLNRWNSLAQTLFKIEIQIKQKCALAFAFIEGSLVKAIQNGYWVLLDEINLANAETLECLSGLLEGSDGSLQLLERGDKEPVRRHPNFTLFACMNPSTDVGKKDLPTGIRNRFTEFFVHELTEKTDLILLVNSYLEAMSLKQKEIQNIVEFYLRVRKDAQLSLCDGVGHKPHFSLRSLCRALSIAGKNPCGTFKRSLYEAFCVSFLTQLDAASYKHVEKSISTHLIGDDKSVKAVMKQPIPRPQIDGDKYVQFEGYWVKKGEIEPFVPLEYILTESVRRNLKDLVRIVAIGKLPVLLQGDTSVGKTSLISYLAKSSGNKCVRINNHEHTDLQEYVGSYVADVTGKLTFREGLLAEAMRKGHWIILDELNLAPTEVLEALNRVLDDNRELFIPETQEVIKADPNFMLFATQNPPGAYGGRKMLSRAFRNRFVELHFNEIPPAELETILHRRCELAPSYAKKMICVMTDLQMRRRGSAAFAGKQGFMTLRDLFRWGERYRLAPKVAKLYDWDQHLADEGYLVLAGRVRKQEEKKEIIEVLQKHLKREVVPFNLFTLNQNTSVVTRHILTKIQENSDKFNNIVWTYNMRQLAVLVGKALEFKEPVLLVGETGGGKTTVCKLLADINGKDLATVNCHMHTESSDFIGGLRPVRDHSENSNKLFEWVDGPLLQAMVKGDFFLADEISLADDSVLERLNSLLEPERVLLLAEKGVDITDPNQSELITAHTDFFFIGTMNPGGDFGKKELSPALRNRFTEIWCEPNTEKNDLIAIIERNIKPGLALGNQQDGSSGVGTSIVDFIDWFKSTEIGKRYTISIRDILTWVNFLNVLSENVDITEAYFHGACLTFIDSLGTGLTSTISTNSLNSFRTQCEEFIVNQIHVATGTVINPNATNLTVDIKNFNFGIGPFTIRMKTDTSEMTDFSFNAPTTVFNTLRLLRGMQLNKAILLEGSPGVGKTSLVTALAKKTGHQIFRVNLSDQTDISDLFGADLPVEGGSGGQFSWRDGPFLQALKQGKWILLDELNLASQSVLEGLNACLDHRGEIFVPELGKTFQVSPGTKFFACQNPLKQGGSRRGLPQSFLNRFIQVFMNSLTSDDLQFILSKLFTQIEPQTLEKMVKFNTQVSLQLETYKFGHKGAPWECNLRDLTRWCEATLYQSEHALMSKNFSPERTVELIYSDRMRTQSDRDKVSDIFEGIFGVKIAGNNPVAYVNEEKVFFGDAFLRRGCDAVNLNVLRQNDACLVLREQVAVLRSLTYCVNMNWMSILVGNSASGKSSAVKTLSQMSGKCLKTLAVTSAMDTTDILGGFEQVDYTRHLDEISRKTERLLLGTLQQLFLRENHDDALAVLGHWESYLLLCSSKTQTMEEECKLFLRKSAKLIAILEILDNFVNKSDKEYLNTLKTKANVIYTSVKQEGTLNSGGKFEWVDSVLIKCLQEGSWLLIDNVNLCSAAVLDRLNGLLETNGVLAIAEKGVDQNGQMVEIKPHKDFRLFLTMDPKNGDISRAMRNRGVEIYLLDHNDTANDFDLKSLINSKGLIDPHQISALIKTHNFVSTLILGEKPQISEILQCSSLISQQLKHGIDVTKAFCNSVIEVYYKSRSNLEFDNVDIIQLIQEEIKKFLNHSDFNNEIELYNENVTLKTQKLESCSELEKIKHQASILHNYLPKCEDNFKLICQILINIYTIASRADLTFRFMYLRSIIHDDPLQSLLGFFKENISFMHFDLRSKSLPVDHNWNPDLIHNDQKDCHKVNLALQITLSDFEETFSDMINPQKKRSKQMSLLKYMQQRKDNKIEDQFNNTIINKYLELIKEYDNFLKEIKQNISNISQDDALKMLYLISWRFIFHKCTLSNIKNLNRSQQYYLQTTLAVHYSWFYKHSVKGILKLCNVTIPKKLDRILNDINSSLEKQFSFIQKIGKNYRKYDNRPPPFTNEHQLESVRIFNEVNESYNIINTKQDCVKILEIFRNNTGLRKALVDVKCCLDYEFKDASKEVALIQSLRENLDVNNKSVSKYYVEIVPLFDSLVRKVVSASFATMNTECFEKLNVENEILVPTELSGLISRFKKSRDPRMLDELYKNFYLYLVHSAAVKPNQYFCGGNDGDNVLNLSSFNPILTYFMCNLLLSGNKITTTTLGNFRELEQQRSGLSLTLWANFNQLGMEKYDFLYCEIQIVLNSCRSFFENFARSLDIQDFNSTTPLQEIVIECINVVKNKIEISNISTSNKELEHFIKLLENCLQNVKKISVSTDPNKILLIISDFHMELSYFKAIFNSTLSIIDPLVKKTLKKQYCLESIEKFAYIKKSFELQNKLFSNTDNTMHCYRDSAVKIISEMEEKNRKLEKYVAFRPEDVLYHTVLQAIDHAFSTILSSEQVNKTISVHDYHILNIIDAVNNKESIDHDHFLSTLSQYESQIVSYEYLVYDWRNWSNSYPDVIEPLLSNVSEFLYGYKTKLSLLKKLLSEYENLQFNVDLNKSLRNLVVVPCLNRKQNSYEAVVFNCMNSKLNKYVETKLAEVKNEEKLRLLKCGIQEAFNHCIFEAKTTNKLNKDLFMQFTKLVDVFITSYNDQEEEKEIRKQESQSLYKIKTKCDDKPENEQIEDELKTLFPNYHSIDFLDLQKGIDLSQEREEIAEDTKITSEISMEDLKNVINMHSVLLVNYTKSEWLNPQKNSNAQFDLVRPLLEKYKLFKNIIDKYANCLNYKMDNELLGSLSLLLYISQKHGHVTDIIEHTSPIRIQASKKRDFYKDSNEEEVKSCYHILEELRLRVNELLQEWPDQPTLKTIDTIIERIYAFDITSPVVRFLTGLELLLSKCKEWEEVAHSGVSLNQFAQSLTEQIIAWRKIELSMWKDLLNITFDNLNAPLSKWWLYLYNILKQYTLERKFTPLELLETMQNFILKSNLAEFQARVDLLYTFHSHAVFLERTVETETFINILWNVYSYFQQFSPIVANKIKDLRGPIEKKLKDYVKIVKWKDIGYWAVMDTVDKTHRTLHKYMREYKDVLLQPVSPYLGNIPSNHVSDNVGIWDRPQRQSPKTYHYTLDPESYITKLSSTKKIQTDIDVNSEILSKLDSYFVKSRKLCKETISTANYPSLIQSLDTFVTDIIETSTHLQNLEIDTTLPKQKQKSQAKSVLQQKQRALSDLFKTLTKIGISYRTGIIELNTDNLANDFLLKPIDISSGMTHLPHDRTDEKIVTIWDSCEMYFNKSLVRRDVLETALKSPAKDLGIANIERCKGFSTHLLTLIRCQKKEFITTSRYQYYLRYYLHQITQICNGTSFLPLKLLHNTTTLLKNITVVMNQYKLILNSCPEEFSSAQQQFEIPLLPGQSSSFQFKNNEEWSKAFSVITNIISSATKFSLNLQKCLGEVPSVECELIIPSYVPIGGTRDFENDLRSLYENLNKLKIIFGDTSLSDSLTWILEEIENIRKEYEIQDQNDDTISNEVFENIIESSTEKVLLVFQNIYKKYAKVITTEEKEADQEETLYQLQDEHLKTQLIQNIASDVNILQMKNVLDSVTQVSKVILTEPPSKLKHCKTLMAQFLPLLEQITQLYQYFITQQVSCYRVSCKMSSVLLNIFIDLVSKGFCTPPDLSDDDMKDEGSSQPTDGLGLGEGQGERDVSDKIESEDQLEDAQPGGKEQEQKEDPDCKEEDKGIEMSEDFDSKLQDKKTEDSENENDSDDERDADEQMGETGKEADQLDQEIWGSDQEEEKEEGGNEEGSEEQGDKGEKDGPDELGANENSTSKKKEDKDQTSPNEEGEEQNKKEINEMDEPEYDDEQTDPYHGNQPEMPEPEPMDLPDDLQLDDGEEKDNEQQEENPFDIDTMKEQCVPEDKEETQNEENKTDENNDEEKDFSSDDEEIRKDDQDASEDNNETDEQKDDQNDEKENKDADGEETQNKAEEDKPEETISPEESGLDQLESNQDNVEAMEVDNADAKDKTQPSSAENQQSSQPIDELCQEDKPDKEGVGQSQMEENQSGHTAQTSVAQNMPSRGEDDEKEKKEQKPGETDSKRTLGDANEPVKKKLKTVDAKETQNDQENEEEEMSVEAQEMYQHIQEAEKESTQVLDAATKEQVEQQKETVQKEDEQSEEQGDSSKDLPEEKEEDMEVVEAEQQISEKNDNSKEKSKNKKQHKEGEVLEDIKDINVEGDVIQTSTVPRGGESFYHTQYSNLQNIILPPKLTMEEMSVLRQEVEHQLSSWGEAPSSIEAEQTWQKISSVTSSLAQDLSEQLRLVLEPTKTTRLKGDYRTGRRINMRKIIPYIASQFRKDKIWLRRTKPSKREYQIVLAIDDSSSMADNHSKELAFESVAVISKALTLLESGELSVISFGETIEVLHKLTEQFTEKTGATLLQKFQFDQPKTRVAKLLDFVTEMLNQSQLRSNQLNAKLLVIVSDGRGVFSEGEGYVREAVRRATLANVFVVFVIVDNPENKSSVLDIRMPVFRDGKLLGIQNYMDVFPFAFYVILKDIDSLPGVLSDALRQWFEIVTNLDKQ